MCAGMFRETSVEVSGVSHRKDGVPLVQIVTDYLT
jgi:hypothetical protein